MAIKGLFIDSWGLVKENIKVRGGHIKSVSFLEGLPQIHWGVFCLLRDSLPRSVITRNWADWQPLRVDADPFLKNRATMFSSRLKKKKKRKKSCSKTYREWTKWTMREQEVIFNLMFIVFVCGLLILELVIKKVAKLFQLCWEDLLHNIPEYRLTASMV